MCSSIRGLCCFLETKMLWFSIFVSFSLLTHKIQETMKACSLLEQEVEQLKQSRNVSGDKTDSTKQSQQALDLFEPSVSAGFSPNSSKERWVIGNLVLKLIAKIIILGS